MSPAAARFALLVVLIVGLTVIAAFLPLHKIQDAVKDLGWWGYPAGILIGAVLLASLVPRTAISIASGALFGVLGGGIVSLASAMLGAIITFAIGRFLGRAEIAAHAGDRLGRLDAWLASTGLVSVIVVRLLPIAPYGLVGYAYGTTSVKYRNYLIGTVIGATPSAFSYAAVGAAVVKPGDIRFVTVLPAIVGFAATGIAAFYWWRLRLRHRADATRDETRSDGETDAPDNTQPNGDDDDVSTDHDAEAGSETRTTSPETTEIGSEPAEPTDPAPDKIPAADPKPADPNATVSGPSASADRDDRRAPDSTREKADDARPRHSPTRRR